MCCIVGSCLATISTFSVSCIPVGVRVCCTGVTGLRTRQVHLSYRHALAGLRKGRPGSVGDVITSGMACRLWSWVAAIHRRSHWGSPAGLDAFKWTQRTFQRRPLSSGSQKPPQKHPLSFLLLLGPLLSVQRLDAAKSLQSFPQASLSLLKYVIWQRRHRQRPQPLQRLAGVVHLQLHPTACCAWDSFFVPAECAKYAQPSSG